MRILDRRPLLIIAGWLLAVALAVGVGVIGIGLVGADLTSRESAPMSEDQVERELRALGSAPPAPVRPSSSTAPIVDGQSFQTRGGIVVADCTRIISLSPAQGFAVAERDDDEGEFRSVSDPADRIEVDLECIGGVPQVRSQAAD